ncbi:hypothetical protein [Enterovirga aerilata]|uniref:Uncharacterized protein n=1 Tax=Enterovirga aerilata TaxID=2730920 RepID=A0A849IG69_9HYPH|nr:hypothetical protein [Enterovirga sp. DB1703]NNM75205.1 hypothetical protein [Enterovirga sp. DB1703]
MIEALRAVLLPLWPALAAAAILGLPFGLVGWRERPAGFWGRLGLILAVLGLAGAAALAATGRVPGRPGLWLEIALAVTFAYLAGCVLGALAGSFRRRRGADPAA